MDGGKGCQFGANRAFLPQPAGHSCVSFPKGRFGTVEPVLMKSRPKCATQAREDAPFP